MKTIKWHSYGLIRILTITTIRTLLEYEKLKYREGLPDNSVGKESTCNAGDPGSLPRLGEDPLEKEMATTPVFFPGKFHEQRSLVGNSPWSHRESAMS